MPVPVPTDIMVRPRVPEAPLRLLPPRGLLNASAALLRSFNGDKMTLDAHADQFFASAEEGAFGLELKRYDYLKSHRLAGRGGWGQKVRHPHDQLFCRQVLYGTVRYEKFLDAFVDGLFEVHKGKLHRKEKYETRIVSYLALLRADELGFGALASLINAHPSSVNFGVPFLEFLFDTSELRTGEVGKKWKQTYDAAWVENVLGGVDLYRDDGELLLKKFKQQVEGFGGEVSSSDDSGDDDGARQRSASRHDDEMGDDSRVRDDGGRNLAKESRQTKKEKSTKKILTATVPEPFALRPSRPRPALPDEPPVAKFKANPVPVGTNRRGPTVDEIAVERQKQKNKETVTEKYADPSLVFKLIASERPSNLDRVIAQVDKERMEALEKVKAELVPIGKPVPNSNQPGFVSKNGPVKTNAAFILRADSVLQKHREKEVAAIENFESGLRDSSGYENWRAKMRAEDEAARLAQIEQTRLEMERSNDDAKAAVDEKFVENAKKGMDARIEKDVLKAKREANESSQMERAKHLKERIELEKKKADLAREALQLEKKANAELRALEKTKTTQKLQMTKKRELERKADLVRRIKAAAAAPDEGPSGAGAFSQAHSKTSMERSVRTADGNGMARTVLLEDMSMAELRERLTLVAKRAERKETNRRERFRTQRLEKETMLADKLADVNRHHEGIAMSLKTRRDTRDLEDAKRRRQVVTKRETDARTVEAKLKAKERDAERAEKIKRAQAEADAFHESTRTASDPTAGQRKERSGLVGQNRTHGLQKLLVAKERFDAAKTRKVESRRAKESREKESREKSAFEMEYEKKLRAAGKEDETMRRDALREKREAVEKERTRVTEMRHTFGRLNTPVDGVPDDGKYAAVKNAVGPGTLKREGLSSNLTRGAFAGTAKVNFGKQHAAETALRDAYQIEFAGTRDTMLDAPIQTGGVARTAAE